MTQPTTETKDPTPEVEEKLRADIARLDAKAAEAMIAGNVDEYHKTIDKMIEIENRYIDEYGTLCLTWPSPMTKRDRVSLPDDREQPTTGE